MQDALFTYNDGNLPSVRPFTELDVQTWLELPKQASQGSDAPPVTLSEASLENIPSLSHLRSTILTTSDLSDYAEQYLQECEMHLHSPRTIQTRRLFINNLLWFLQYRGYRECGTPALRQFFYYLAHGHEEPGGRFGNKHLTRPVRPITVRDYYNCLRPLFDWLATQGFIADTPFQGIPQPRVREEVKPPLSPEQVKALLQAAQATTQPLRDVAILSFLLDTGCRASELISIQRKDVDLNNCYCTVLGKGNKYRTIYFGAKTATALVAYIESFTDEKGSAIPPNDQSAPLFSSGAGAKALTRSGLLQLTRRLSRMSGMTTSCSPHAFRRTFAVQTLRNGANVFSVQAMLGHTNLQMTRRYCALAQADVEAQHRQFSPLDRLQS